MKFSIFQFLKQQIILLVCCFSFIANAQDILLSDNAQISVLTCGSGDEMYSIYGHTAIRVSDVPNNIDAVFNYGMFDFRTPNFYMKFVQGNLFYTLAVEDYYDFVDYYKINNRSVNEQYLNLNLDQKQRIWDEIRRQYASDDRFYLYKFVDTNCTTKVADLLNSVLKDSLQTNFKGNNLSERVILDTFLKDKYFEKLGINLLFGKKVDQLNDHVFLPEKLMQSIALSSNDGRPLVQNDILLYQQKEVEKGNNWNTIYFFSIICLLLIFVSGVKIVRSMLFVLFGLLGTLILVLSLISNHQELNWNDSLLLLNPLYFLILIPKIRKTILALLVFGCISFVLVASFDKLLDILPLAILIFVYVFRLIPRSVFPSFKKL